MTTYQPGTLTMDFDLAAVTPPHEGFLDMEGLLLKARDVNDFTMFIGHTNDVDTLIEARLPPVIDAYFILKGLKVGKVESVKLYPIPSDKPARANYTALHTVRSTITLV